MARKTGIIYSKEYQDLVDKTKALEVRIKKRALELCNKFPDVDFDVIQEDNNIIKSNTNRIINVHDGNDFSLNTDLYIRIISGIEVHNEKQSGYVQTSMYDNEPKDFIEYEDIDDNYKSPERKEVAEILEIRLYCMHEDCNKYIKGFEGYNGAFSAETGQPCDLRNQGFTCKEHREDEKKDDLFPISEYPYEFLVTDENSPFEINTWIPTTKERIKDPSKIDEYIAQGLFRKRK